MPKQSAGLLMFRYRDAALEVFLVHPGGPYWAKKDQGVWSIPKGEHGSDEEPLEAAQREFYEETGFTPEGEFLELGTVKQAAGKLVSVWALEGDCDPSLLVSGSFQMEWPPRSGRQVEFPEVDRGEWFSLEEARRRMLSGQTRALDLLTERLGAAKGEESG